MSDIKIEFPKWVYHPSKDAIIVLSQEELRALGNGWKEEPFGKNASDSEKKHEREDLQPQESKIIEGMSDDELMVTLLKIGYQKRQLKGKTREAMIGMIEEKKT